MTQPRLFAELCAGLASVSLCLQGGQYARPPVSRMGSKAGYARAVLAVLGLRPGQGAGSYLWVEADPSVARLLDCYPDPERLRAVAEVIRGWVGEDARQLWERLRGERFEGEAEEVGRWSWVLARSAHGKTTGFRSQWDSQGTRHWADDAPAADLSALSLIRWPEHVRVVQGDAAGADAREMARWLWMVGNSWRGDGQHWKEPADSSWSATMTADEVARRLDRTGAIPWPPVAVYPGPATDPEPVGDLSGCVVYMDPPYVGTTGYAHDIPREQVVEVARRWSDAGATVCVSEAEPLGLPGWHEVDITGERRGQARTFARVKSEWLTLNRPPAWRPAVQRSLFAVGGAT